MSAPGKVSAGRRCAHEKLCAEVVRCALDWSRATENSKELRAWHLKNACDALDKFETEGLKLKPEKP